MAQSCATFPTSTQIFQVKTRSRITQIQSTDCVQTECAETIVVVVEQPITYESKNILYQTSCSESPQSYSVTTTPISPTITSFTPISPSQTASKSETSGAAVGPNVGPIEPSIATNTFITEPIEPSIATNTFITGPNVQNATSNPRAMIIETVVSTSVALIMLVILVCFLLRRRRARRNGTRPIPYIHGLVQPTQSLRAKPPLLDGTTLLATTRTNFERDTRTTIKEQISSSVPLSHPREPVSINPPPPYTA